MDGEEYAEAAKVYGSILNDNPKDPEALVGLTKARYKWIDKSLIDVRMLRLSQQAASATDLLKQL
jgi:virulence-associated protein VapD